MMNISSTKEIIKHGTLGILKEMKKCSFAFSIDILIGNDNMKKNV